MKTEIIYWFLLGIILVIPALLWIRTFFTRSFAPIQGEIYIITFLGIHILEVRLGDPKAKWYQKLGFYILFWPFGRASFIYEWVQEMTYADYLKKVEKAKTTKDYDVSVEWEPEYDKGGKNPDGSTRESEIDDNGMPKDKSIKILVSRKEKMYSLRQIEGYTLAAEFETLDGFSGWRFFTLFLNVDNLSKIISKIRQWQTPAKLTFKGEYNAWSKKVTYVQLRQITMDKLNIELGNDKNKPFTDEIDRKVDSFGYSINSTKEGSVYLDISSKDLLESQELPKKAKDKQDAALIEVETAKTKARGEADSVKIKAEGEAERIKIVGKASNDVLGERIEKLKNLYGYQKDLIVAKYGTEGLKNLKFYIEGNGSGNSDVQKMVDALLALNIHDELKQEGGS